MEPAINLEINDTFIPLWDCHRRFLVMLGGSGSGKSRFAAQKIVMRAVSEKPHRLLCIRKVGRDLKESVMHELRTAMIQMNLWHEFQENKSERIFTHVITGNQIICKGLDDPEKLKSISEITSMWIEEATELAQEDFDQLNIRIRGIKGNYVQFIMTFNGIHDNHWIRQRFFQKQREDTMTHQSTYLDNYYLDDEYKQQLEAYKDLDPYFYDVYTKGRWGIVNKSKKFLFNFNEEHHVSQVGINPSVALRLSFDFNIDPFAVAVYQKINETTIHIVGSIRETGDIDQVCDKIISTFGERGDWIVTGDASGKARTGVVRGKRSYWQAVRNRLSLGNAQLRLRSRNLDLVESRIICNAVLKRCNILIDSSYKELINDCNFAIVDDHGVLVKDRKNHKNDDLDAFRYLLDAEFPDIVKYPQKYSTQVA